MTRGSAPRIGQSEGSGSGSGSGSGPMRVRRRCRGGCVACVPMETRGRGRIAGVAEYMTEEKEGEEGSTSKEKRREWVHHIGYVLVYWYRYVIQGVFMVLSMMSRK